MARRSGWSKWRGCIDSMEDDKNFSKIYGGEYGTEGTRGVSLR